MAEINKDLLRSKIIHSRELTALEKRYLEKLVYADQLRSACGCKCAYTKTGKAAVTAMCAKFQTYTDPVFCGLCGSKDDYVSVTPDVLRVNREYLHKDILKMLEEHPEIFEEDEEDKEE